MKEVIKNLEDAIKADWREVYQCSARITTLEVQTEKVKKEKEEHTQRIAGRKKALMVLRMAEGLEAKEAT